MIMVVAVGVLPSNESREAEEEGEQGPAELDGQHFEVFKKPVGAVYSLADVADVEAEEYDTDRVESVDECVE